MAGVAIAVMPQPPRDRWERIGNMIMVGAIVLIVLLFVYSLLDSYVF
jgi:hypothetical protein